MWSAEGQSNHQQDTGYAGCHQDVSPELPEAFWLGTHIAQEDDAKAECAVLADDCDQRRGAHVDAVPAAAEQTCQHHEIAGLHDDAEALAREHPACVAGKRAVANAPVLREDGSQRLLTII